MSREYDLYLEQHKANVAKGYEWIRDNLPGLLEGITNLEWQICFKHDASKSELDEYVPYDNYFYGGNRSYAVVQEFRYAWLRHIHRNPHHWQYWVLINDDPNEDEIIMDMPYHYIIEMICDWWAFSWVKGDLGEIFNWYNEHKDYMKLSSNTRKSVENILEAIGDKLNEKEIYELVKNVSSMTHAHEISILGCYIYILYINNLLNGKDKYASYNMIKIADYSMFSEVILSCLSENGKCAE